MSVTVLPRTCKAGKHTVSKHPSLRSLPLHSAAVSDVRGRALGQKQKIRLAPKVFILSIPSASVHLHGIVDVPKIFYHSSISYFFDISWRSLPSDPIAAWAKDVTAARLGTECRHSPFVCAEPTNRRPSKGLSSWDTDLRLLSRAESQRTPRTSRRQHRSPKGQQGCRCFGLDRHPQTLET